MFARLSTVLLYVVFTFAVLAAAKPWGSPPPTTTAPKPPVTTTVTVTATGPATTVTSPASQCNTGDLQCCNSVQSASSSAASLLLGLLGIVLQDVNVLVGLTCTSILGGNGCTAQAVCCENNNFNGLIAIGCSPVNLNL